jgi:hypothetical protein
MKPIRPLLGPLLLLAASSSCMSLDYDLSSVPLPMSAKPAETGAGEVESFEIEARHILWVHGLFGRTSPDVAALVRERAEGYDRIAGFRVSQSSSIHHWLTTHLTLSLIRMRTVHIEGELVRDPGP